VGSEGVDELADSLGFPVAERHKGFDAAITLDQQGAHILWEPPGGKAESGEGRDFVSTSVRAEKAPIILRFAPATWVWFA